MLSLVDPTIGLWRSADAGLPYLAAELAQEDLLIAVQRMDHQIQDLHRLSLETEDFMLPACWIELQHSPCSQFLPSSYSTQNSAFMGRVTQYMSDSTSGNGLPSPPTAITPATRSGRSSCFKLHEYDFAGSLAAALSGTFNLCRSAVERIRPQGPPGSACP